MELIMFVFRFFFIMLCFRVISNILRAVFKNNSFKNKGNITKQREQRRSNPDGQDIESEKKPVLQMVKDELCGAHIQKEKAYIVLDSSGKRYYFCSWDCRQKFINNSSNIK